MAILSLQDYVNSDLDRVALPDYTDLGVTSVKNILIPFDQIHIDDIEGNSQKVETHTAEEIETLRMSFSEGVDTAEFPPGVYYRGGDKPYVLIYGFGRCEAIRALKQKEWAFTLLEGTPEQMEDVQARENEGYPKRLNKEVDMRKHLSRKVSNGRIKNTEEAIRKEFKRIYPNRKKDVMNRVVQMVIGECDTPQPYILYTSPSKVQDWIDNHSSVEHKIGGEYNPNTDTHGVCIGEGYQYRVILQAVERFVKTGKFTDIIGHVGAPTKMASIDMKRKKFLKQLESHIEELKECGMHTFPFRVIGFLPQDKEKESLKTLIRI
jgi:hypothetical protein